VAEKFFVPGAPFLSSLGKMVKLDKLGDEKEKTLAENTDYSDRLGHCSRGIKRLKVYLSEKNPESD
jgi:hypothetical protein